MPSLLKSANTLLRSGFRCTHLTTDLALGVIDGLDTTLWCYIYASIIFAGAFTAFLPLGIVLVLIGWAAVSVYIALTSKEPLHVAYLHDSRRTATVIADTDAVLYHLDIAQVAHRPLESAAIHELVATTLADRVSYMNARMLV